MTSETDVVAAKVSDLLRRAKAADAGGLSASAFEFFQRVAELDPSRESAIYRAALNLLEVGRLSDAETFLSKIGTTSKGKLWLVELLLGRLRMAQYRPTEAEMHFAKASDLNPETTEPAIYLGNCLYK